MGTIAVLQARKGAAPMAHGDREEAATSKCKDRTYGTIRGKFWAPAAWAGGAFRGNRKREVRRETQTKIAGQRRSLAGAQLGPALRLTSNGVAGSALVQQAQRRPAAPPWLLPTADASRLPSSFCRMAGTGGRSLPT